jgi:hypothetical protein
MNSNRPYVQSKMVDFILSVYAVHIDELIVSVCAVHNDGFMSSVSAVGNDSHTVGMCSR